MKTNNWENLPSISPRRLNTNKSDFGRVLVIGGSRGMAGAISMSASAALYSGAALVKVAVPDCCLETVASFRPEFMTIGLPNDPTGKMASGSLQRLSDHLEWADVIAIGPGSGLSDTLCCVVSNLFENSSKPLVIDADGLNAIAKSGVERLKPRDVPCVWTPHPAEFERITGISSNNRTSQIGSAKQLASRLSINIVLKGHQTLITDGNLEWINESGTPAMAVGGSGDILTGLIAGLWAQNKSTGLSRLDAIRLAVWAHGKAAENCINRNGGLSVLPTELLPEARCQLGKQIQT